MVLKSQCKLSLLDNSGNVPKQSGLNWGFSNGHVKEGDAYIAIREKDIDPAIFPAKSVPNESIKILWDDGTSMEGLLEGNNHDDGTLYPKQLCSRPHKNILGIYLRKRLGVPLDHLITKEDLLDYGRTDIEVTLIDDVYHLDFSVQK